MGTSLIWLAQVGVLQKWPRPRPPRELPQVDLHKPHCCGEPTEAGEIFAFRALHDGFVLGNLLEEHVRRDARAAAELAALEVAGIGWSVFGLVVVKVELRSGQGLGFGLDLLGRAKRVA